MLFVSVAFIFFLAGMEVDIFIPSYPELQQQFNLSPAKVQLCLSINFVTYCIASLYSGSLADRYGLRKTILGGLSVFIAGSIACAFASEFSSILIGRALQGLGMAAPASLGYVVIAERYSSEKTSFSSWHFKWFYNCCHGIRPGNRELRHNLCRLARKFHGFTCTGTNIF